MNKKVLLLSLGLLSSFVLSCNKGGKSEEMQTIDYAFWGDPDAIGVEQTIIDGFQEKFPQLKVKPIAAPYSQYQTKLLTLIGGGAAPDVMRIDSNFRTNFLKVLKDLNPVVKEKNFDLSIYYPGAINDATTNDGKLIGLPWGYAPFYFLINLDVLEAYDMEMPNLNWTISDFYQMAQEVYEKSEGKIYGGAKTNADLPQEFLYTANTDFFTPDYSKSIINTPKAIAGLSRFVKLYEQGIFPRDMVNPQYKSMDDFIAGNYLFLMNASSLELFKAKKAGVHFEAWPFPVSDDGNLQTTLVKSNTYSIYKDTKKLDAAWNFLTYHRGPEGEKFNAEAKRVPPAIISDKLLRIYADIQPDKYPQRYIEIYDVINNQGHTHPIQLPQNYDQINKIISIYWQKTLLGEMELQEAMDQAAAEVNDILQK